MFGLINSTKETYGRHIWACRSCMSAVDSLNKKMLRMEKQITTIEKTVNSNTGAIKAVDDKVDNVVKDMATLQKTTSSDTLKDDVFAELNDRATRKANIVIYNIQEPAGETSDQRKAEDRTEVTKIFKVISDSVNVEQDMKFMYRVGEKEKTDQPRPRPLIIGLRKDATAEMILSNCRNLRNSDYNFISVVPDLTHRQRQEEDQMRQEVNRKNEERTEEESENWEWKMLGPRGQRKIVKSRINPDLEVLMETNSQSNPRGKSRTNTRKRNTETRPEGTSPPPAARHSSRKH